MSTLSSEEEQRLAYEAALAALSAIARREQSRAAQTGESARQIGRWADPARQVRGSASLRPRNWATPR